MKEITFSKTYFDFKVISASILKASILGILIAEILRYRQPLLLQLTRTS